MKIVFDTNVLISSTLWDGSVAQKLLFKLIRIDAKIYSSPEIISEYQKILKRDFDYTDEEVSSIIGKLLNFITLVELNQKVDIIKDDPEDNKIIECALASFSEYIITYDKHLLKIKNFKEIKIITPEESLKIV